MGVVSHAVIGLVSCIVDVVHNDSGKECGCCVRWWECSETGTFILTLPPTRAFFKGTGFFPGPLPLKGPIFPFPDEWQAIVVVYMSAV